MHTHRLSLLNVINFCRNRSENISELVVVRITTEFDFVEVTPTLIQRNLFWSVPIEIRGKEGKGEGHALVKAIGEVPTISNKTYVKFVLTY